MSEYNGAWIHNLLDIEPDSWETITVDGKDQQIMRVYLTDVNTAHRAGWFGVVEWRYEKDEESYTFINSKSFSEASAISWITRNMSSFQFHPSRWGLLVFAQNKRQVQDWLLQQGIPVRTAYNVQYPSIEDHATMKENRMNVRERRLAQAQRTIERAQAQIDRLMAMPDEPSSKDGQPLVIFFQKQFSGRGPYYDYAAVKAGDGLWYTTGPKAPKGYRWDALVDWIFEYSDDVVIELASKFKPLA